MLTNPQHIRTLRYALGVTIALALSSAIAWPLSFLLPVLSAMMLALPMPKPGLQQAIRNMRDALFAFGVGYIITQFILPHTVIYIPLLALALFHTYYHLNRGGSFWLVLMLLLCLLLMPMLAGLHEGLAIGVALGLVWSSWLTIGILWLSHFLVPDSESAQGAPAKQGFHSGYLAPAAEAAMKSTLVTFPLAIMFIANNLSSQIIVLVFAAIFTLSPNLEKGKAAGMNSMKSSLIGGSVAFFVYWALVAVPEYHFLVLLMFFVSLGFGRVIYSGRPVSKYLPSAMVVVIVLVNSSLAADAGFSENLLLRIIFITLATMYVVISLKVLDAFWHKQLPVNS